MPTCLSFFRNVSHANYRDKYVEWGKKRKIVQTLTFSARFQFRKAHRFSLIWNVLLDLFSLQLCLLIFLKTMKLYKDICSAWISRTSTDIFFLIDWHYHKRLKNTIDLLLLYGEHFMDFRKVILLFWFSEKILVFPKFFSAQKSSIAQSFGKKNTEKRCPIYSRQDGVKDRYRSGKNRPLCPTFTRLW